MASDIEEKVVILQQVKNFFRLYSGFKALKSSKDWEEIKTTLAGVATSEKANKILATLEDFYAEADKIFAPYPDLELKRGALRVNTGRKDDKGKPVYEELSQDQIKSLNGLVKQDPIAKTNMGIISSAGSISGYSLIIEVLKNEAALIKARSQKGETVDLSALDGRLGGIEEALATLSEEHTTEAEKLFAIKGIIDTLDFRFNEIASRVDGASESTLTALENFSNFVDEKLNEKSDLISEKIDAFVASLTDYVPRENASDPANTYIDKLNETLFKAIFEDIDEVKAVASETRELVQSGASLSEESINEIVSKVLTDLAIQSKRISDVELKELKNIHGKSQAALLAKINQNIDVKYAEFKELLEKIKPALDDKTIQQLNRIEKILQDLEKFANKSLHNQKVIKGLVIAALSVSTVGALAGGHIAANLNKGSSSATSFYIDSNDSIENRQLSYYALQMNKLASNTENPSIQAETANADAQSQAKLRAISEFIDYISSINVEGSIITIPAYGNSPEKTFDLTNVEDKASYTTTITAMYNQAENNLVNLQGLITAFSKDDNPDPNVYNSTTIMQTLQNNYSKYVSYTLIHIAIKNNYEEVFGEGSSEGKTDVEMIVGLKNSGKGSADYSDIINETYDKFFKDEESYNPNLSLQEKLEAIKQIEKESHSQMDIDEINKFVDELFEMAKKAMGEEVDLSVPLAEKKKVISEFIQKCMNVSGTPLQDSILLCNALGITATDSASTNMSLIFQLLGIHYEEDSNVKGDEPTVNIGNVSTNPSQKAPEKESTDGYGSKSTIVIDGVEYQPGE